MVERGRHNIKLRRSLQITPKPRFTSLCLRLFTLLLLVSLHHFLNYVFSFSV